MLRRIGLSDLASFQAYRHDDLLGQYQGWSPTTDDEASLFLSEMSIAELLQPGSWIQLGIADPGSQTLVGDIGLLLADDGQHAEIGFTLSRQSQGRGIATAAVREALSLVFERTVAERILGVTDSRNLRSIRLLERVGMRLAETRSAKFRGEDCIEHVYSIPRQQKV